MKVRVHIVVFLAAFVGTLSLIGSMGAAKAVAGPPNYLCTYYNLGQVIQWSDGKRYRCRVSFVNTWPYYSWLDIGYPV